MNARAESDPQRTATQSDSANALQALGALLNHPRTAEANDIIVSEGSRPLQVTMIESGWAMRYKTLADGRRQVLDFLLPGDIVGLFTLGFDQTEYGVQALTTLTTRSISATRMLAELSRNPRFALTLNSLAGRTERRMDEQLMRLGRRSTEERMAHLFVELHQRLLRSAHTHQESCCLPITQKAIADHLGMSQVHANRTFRALFKKGLVALCEGEIMLLDLEGLIQLGGFEDAYLDDATVVGYRSEQSFCA